MSRNNVNTFREFLYRCININFLHIIQFIINCCDPLIFILSRENILIRSWFIRFFLHIDTHEYIIFNDFFYIERFIFFLLWLPVLEKENIIVSISLSFLLYSIILDSLKVDSLIIVSLLSNISSMLNVLYFLRISVLFLLIILFLFAFKELSLLLMLFVILFLLFKLFEFEFKL